MKDIIKTCNSMVRVSKFTSNKKIYENFEGFLFKLVWRETFSISHGLTYGSFFFFLFGPSKNIIVYCNRTMSLLIEEEEEEPNNACTLNLQIKHLDFRGALNDIY